MSEEPFSNEGGMEEAMEEEIDNMQIKHENI